MIYCTLCGMSISGLNGFQEHRSKSCPWKHDRTFANNERWVLSKPWKNFDRLLQTKQYKLLKYQCSSWTRCQMQPQKLHPHSKPEIEGSGHLIFLKSFGVKVKTSKVLSWCKVVSLGALLAVGLTIRCRRYYTDMWGFFVAIPIRYGGPLWSLSSSFRSRSSALSALIIPAQAAHAPSYFGRCHHLLLDQIEACP